MRQILLVFLGGGAGSVLRFLASDFTKNLWKPGAFPIGTFAVNVFGCFLIGIFISLFSKADDNLRFLLVTGFCGGFTTFSALSAENFSLIQSGNYTTLVCYILLSVIMGVFAVFLGTKAGSFI